MNLLSPQFMQYGSDVFIRRLRRVVSCIAPCPLVARADEVIE
jgi:hypothetical protein